MPTEMTRLQNQTLTQYLDWHEAQFLESDMLYRQMCNADLTTLQSQLSTNAGVVTGTAFDLLAYRDEWSTNTQVCTYRDGSDFVRWRGTGTAQPCTVPNAIVLQLPTWNATSALEMRLCQLLDKSQISSFAFWTSRQNTELGLEFLMQSGRIAGTQMFVSMPGIPPISIESSLTDLNSFSVACENYLVMQPVWVGRLLIWQISDLYSTEYALIGASVWPEHSVSASVSVEFWLELDDDVHLLNSRLSILRGITSE